MLTKRPAELSIAYFVVHGCTHTHTQVTQPVIHTCTGVAAVWTVSHGKGTKEDAWKGATEWTNQETDKLDSGKTGKNLSPVFVFEWMCWTGQPDMEKHQLRKQQDDPPLPTHAHGCNICIIYVNDHQTIHPNTPSTLNIANGDIIMNINVHILA